jgi:hypothetical protein
MRWVPLHYRSPHPLSGLWMWPLIAALSPVWAPLAALWWLENQRCKLMGPTAEWRPWFAWHPITIPFEDQAAVWLEWVERRTYYSRTEYRLNGDNGQGADTK